MKQIAKIIIIFSFLTFFTAPMVILAADSSSNLVPCGVDKTPLVTDPTTHKQTGGDVINPCDGVNGWKNLMQLVNNVISFVLFRLAVPIAAICFAYAGFMLVTSGGSTEQKSKAKNTFTSVAIGLIFAVAAWLIVHTILSILGYSGSWIGF